ERNAARQRDRQLDDALGLAEYLLVRENRVLRDALAGDEDLVAAGDRRIDAARRHPARRLAAGIADLALAHAEFVDAETLLDLRDDAARVAAEDAACRRQQRRRITGAHLFGTVAEDEPGELFRIGQLGVGDELDDRPLRAAADLDASLDGETLAHGADIERRVVGQALESERAAL